jgi:hypothetical protein
MWGIFCLEELSWFQEAPCAVEFVGGWLVGRLVGWFYTTADVKPVKGKKLSVQNFQVGHIMLNQVPSNTIQNYTYSIFEALQHVSSLYA